MRELVTVYFDYLCPFAWRAAELTELIKDPLGLEFKWHHFSLYQSNYRGDDNWQLWNEPLDLACESGCKGLLPFLGSCAARQQGPEGYNAFRLNLMRARHRNHQSMSYETLRAVAAASGLHLPTFERDLSNPEFRTHLAHEHHHCAELDVFGTPTFHFGGGQLAYFRIRDIPTSKEEAIDLFTSYRNLLEHYPYLETIKRPRAKGN